MFNNVIEAILNIFELWLFLNYWKYLTTQTSLLRTDDLSYTRIQNRMSIGRSSSFPKEWGVLRTLYSTPSYISPFSFPIWDSNKYTNFIYNQIGTLGFLTLY